jgi:DNA-binding CsgD family transcriptional regulator
MKDFNNTVLDIYSAPGNLNGWKNAVESISILVDGQASGYFIVNNETQETEIATDYGFPQYMYKYYAGAEGAKRDVRFKYLHNLLPGKVFRDFEFVPDMEEYDNSDWIQYQLQELGVYYCMSAMISTHGLWNDFISINRLKSKGPHTDQEKANLQLLLPHLSKASELHLLVSSLENKYGAVLSVLDKFLVGLIILDKSGRIATINKAAKEIIDSSGSFKFTHKGYFNIIEEDLNFELHKIIEQTNATSTHGGNSYGNKIIIRCRSNGENILLEIMPIRDDGFLDNDNIQGTAIFLMDPSKSQFFSAEGLAQIFKLTQSETMVTNSLVNGLSLNDIAEDRNTSVETVRGHIKNIFSKTGANSQLGLLRLAVKANPPIEIE